LLSYPIWLKEYLGNRQWIQPSLSDKEKSRDIFEQLKN
jgi:hypothetical protein